ncbi:MAG: hypothetical protein ACLQDL_15470 [Spirochaetia bacterium]
MLHRFAPGRLKFQSIAGDTFTPRGRWAPQDKISGVDGQNVKHPNKPAIFHLNEMIYIFVVLSTFNNRVEHVKTEIRELGDAGLDSRACRLEALKRIQEILPVDAAMLIDVFSSFFPVPAFPREVRLAQVTPAPANIWKFLFCRRCACR